MVEVTVPVPVVVALQVTSCAKSECSGLDGDDSVTSDASLEIPLAAVAALHMLSIRKATQHSKGAEGIPIVPG